MFRRISYKIALQFTAFVFLLFLINGVVFLAVDFGNAGRQMRFRLERVTEGIAYRFEPNVSPLPPVGLPPGMRDRVRILDPEGKVLFNGALMSDVPFVKGEGFAEVIIQGEQYAILTEPIMREGKTKGYVQVADVVRFPRGDLPERALLYLLVSFSISALTFFVGLFFARRSLKPAEQMLERLEQFTQDASHELRTPLATLGSSLDLALKNGNYREGLLSAKQDLRDVAVLVERLLELARLDKFVLETGTVDLSALVGEVVEKLRPLAAEKHVTLIPAITPHVTVSGDATLLRQVVGNLLSNAIKFNTPQGTVDIRLTPHRLDVQDTGIGIAEHVLHHIFDRFYQAESSRAKGGFGLGLALVKRIVELHGWSIAVESAEGKGSTFTMTLTSQA